MQAALKYPAELGFKLKFTMFSFIFADWLFLINCGYDAR